MNLLLLSNSTQYGRGYLEHALGTVTGFLPAQARLAFVPYALADHDAYTARVRGALEGAGIAVHGVHEGGDPLAQLAAADAVFIGGGNSFRLLSALYRTGLRDAVREAVRAGLPYMGASAGTNMAAPTLRTTNDMPIVQPPSFETLGLVPFQINPHYLDPDPSSTHKGETREERLTEFLEENDVPVLGLREGSWLRVAGERASVEGGRPAGLCRRGAAP
ncbi:dipeptidase PepE, partial [Streptomyces boluensis]